MKVQLTPSFCATARCQPGKRKTDYWNIGDPVGLVMECRESGRATFYLRYQDIRSQQRQIKLGGYPEISLDQARKAARRLRSEVVMGGDPLAAKKEKRAVPTYATLAQQHIGHAKVTQRSWWSTEGLLNKHVVPRFGRMRLDEICSQEVAKFLADKLAEGLSPASCEKLRILIGRSYQLAQDWGTAGAERNPARGVKLPPFNNKRERLLSPAEMERLLIAVDASANVQLGAIVRLLAYTGARLSELLHARWEHVEVLDHKSWHIPMSKNGKGRHVPLAQAAIDVIEKLPTFDGCPYLVPNPETGKPFVSIKHAWQTARREARLPDLRLHDIRHHAASRMVAAGVSLYAVGKILGHSRVVSTERYSHLANDTLLAAVEAGAANMNCKRH
jgi:integrase